MIELQGDGETTPAATSMYARIHVVNASRSLRLGCRLVESTQCNKHLHCPMSRRVKACTAGDSQPQLVHFKRRRGRRSKQASEIGPDAVEVV